MIKSQKNGKISAKIQITEDKNQNFLNKKQNSEEIKMNENRFYICEHCGNLVEMVNDSKVPMMCCGQKMKALEPGVVEASHEKHIPVVKVEGNLVSVKVGSVEHPMSEEHSILWIYLKTDKGGYRRNLEPGKVPEAIFALHDEKPLEVFAYCNLHGLWKAEV